MIEITRETDVELLRQVAGLLDRENLRLISKIEELSEVIQHLSGRESANAQMVLEILAEIRVHRELTFQIPAEASDEPREEPSQDSSSEKDSEPESAQTGHGPRPQENLPHEDKDWELPESQRDCEVCHGTLQEMLGQYEESVEITVKEREFKIIQHRRKKYRCTCNSNVVTAPGPQKLIPGGRYSVEFAIEVAIGKYLDHMPLERQVRIMSREGLEVSSQTLWDQLNALGKVLEPSYEALKQRVLNTPVLFADETRWRYMRKNESKNWFVWCISNPDAVFYKIFDNRSADCARELLTGYRGTVVADGYGVYKSLARAGPSEFLLAHCWAHALRKFRDIQEDYPRECSEILGKIGDLYRLERNVAKALSPSAQESMRLQFRVEMRDFYSRKLIHEIRDWAFDQKGKALPQSTLGKAVQYLLNQWVGLTRFLDNPRIPLDNNAAERALRGVVVGRKNHYGSRSKRGAEVAALLYSLLETAKLCGVEPRDYLLRAIRTALECPGTVTLPEPAS